MVSASAALQTISDIFLQAFPFCAINRICSKSSFFFRVGTGKSLLINFALVVSLFNVATIFSRGSQIWELIVCLEFMLAKCSWKYFLQKFNMKRERTKALSY